ncbi:hypothetical protein TSAR_007263 [Trichomalopsis sarcophagae]|uniref:Uncharacterized protein n=1 Tax=Trichomalopsis sarcophagae TaxID=543379 RepID=A0A232EGG9_9HYME|nr:hypothetical protein TSAR_007263 [Trichomalopsis sarcophagae]
MTRDVWNEYRIRKQREQINIEQYDLLDYRKCINEASIRVLKETLTTKPDIVDPLFKDERTQRNSTPLILNKPDYESFQLELQILRRAKSNANVDVVTNHSLPNGIPNATKLLSDAHIRTRGTPLSNRPDCSS